MGTGIVLPPVGGGGSGTAGLIDLSSVTGTADKVDLTSVTTQSRLGYGITFKAGGAIQCGQPVIYNYASGVATSITAGALPAQHEVIGIALEDAASGADVNVLTQGFATARRDTTFLASAETVELDATTTGTTRNLTNATTFLDSGGSGNDYTANQNYLITFDAGLGYDTKITVNDFAFEHSTYTMYDKLAIQGSNDGANFTNLSVEWLQAAADSSAPFAGGSFAGSSWNSSSSKNGWILPKDTPRAILIGGVPSNSFPADIVTSYRYIRFYFRCDNSSHDDGWDITLAPNTAYSTNVETVAEGTTLYLSTTDYTKVTTDNASGIVVGYAAYDNAENNSLFVRV
jgi:hypothetical protein